jgi:hypothetical protein
MTESTQRNTYLGFFAQSDWRMLPNATLSYGLRYETESIIRDRNNWSPRISLAYDPFKSGRTVLRLGGGIFYNRACSERLTTSPSVPGSVSSTQTRCATRQPEGY